MNDSLDSVIEKIAKLRSLATSSNANEAATAAAIADALISKHQLSEADLIIKGEKDDESISVIGEHLHESGRVMPWIHQLAHVLCEQYGCSYYVSTVFDPSIIQKNPKAKRATVQAFVMVGRKSDADIVRYFFAWLKGEVERLTKTNARGQGFDYSQNYALGCVNGIHLQLRAERDKLKAEAKANNQSSALALMDNKHKEAYAYMCASTKLSKGTSSSLRRNEDAYFSGTADGKRIQLKKGIGDSSGTKLLS